MIKIAMSASSRGRDIRHPIWRKNPKWRPRWPIFGHWKVVPSDVGSNMSSYRFLGVLNSFLCSKMQYICHRDVCGGHALALRSSSCKSEEEF